MSSALVALLILGIVGIGFFVIYQRDHNNSQTIVTPATDTTHVANSSTADTTATAR